MSKTNKYSPEVRERAVRLVLEARKDYPSLWSAVESIAPKIGCAAVTLHEWVKKHEIEVGVRDGVPLAERERIKALEREDRCAQSAATAAGARDWSGPCAGGDRAAGAHGAGEPGGSEQAKGVCLFVGPSGVGKTETALALADILYGGERKLVTINMSEYQEAHSVSVPTRVCSTMPKGARSISTTR